MNLAVPAALAAAATLVGGASAQEIRVSGHLISAGHELLGNPAGVGAAVGFQLSERVGVRVGYERSRARFESVRSTCVGLAFPGDDCGAELRSNRARMHAYRVAVPIVVGGGGRLSVLLVPGVSDVWLDSTQEGERTGRTRSAEKDMYGLELGVEVRVRLSERAPFHVTVGGVLASLHRWRDELRFDGYSPFERRFGLARLELELAVSAFWR